MRLWLCALGLGLVPGSYALIALCSAAWYWKTLEVRRERDQDEVENEDRHADQALDDHELAPVVSIGSQLVTRAGVTLKSRSAKPIAIANAKISAPRPISVETSSSSPSSCAA